MSRHASVVSRLLSCLQVADIVAGGFAADEGISGDPESRQGLLVEADGVW